MQSRVNHLAGSSKTDSYRFSAGFVAAVYFLGLYLIYCLCLRISNFIELVQAGALVLEYFGPPFSLPLILGEELVIGSIFAAITYALWSRTWLRILWIVLLGAYLVWLALNQLAFEYFFTHVDHILYSASHDLKNLSSSITESVDAFFIVHMVSALSLVVALLFPYRPRFVFTLSAIVIERPLHTILAALLYLSATATFGLLAEQHGLSRSFPSAYVLSYLDVRAEEKRIEQFESGAVMPPKAMAMDVDASVGETQDRNSDIEPIADKGRKLNVVVYLMESTSYRETSLLPEAPYDTTPFLKELAKKSLLFNDYYTVVAASTRTVFSLLTGVYPYMDRTPDLTKYSQLRIPALPDIFHKNGYQTAFFASSDSMFEGLDTFLTNRAYDVYMDKNLVPKESLRKDARNYWGLDEEIMIDQALKWIEQVKDSGQPFYLNYNAVYPHHPFRVPKQHDHLNKMDWGEHRIRSRFRASLRYADMSVRRFFEGLKKLGVLDDTLFIVMPDHGETFGDLHKKNFVHAEYCYEEDSRIFLLLHNPKVLGPPRIDAKRGSHLDFMPTILDLLGIDYSDMPIDGQSLVSNDYVQKKMFFFSRRQMAHRDGDFKLLIDRVKHKKAELYDLAADPEEQENLVAQYPEKKKAYTETILEWQATVAKAYRSRVAALNMKRSEISKLSEQKRRQTFGDTRILFKQVNVCPGVGNTTCTPSAGKRSFNLGQSITILGLARKRSFAQLKAAVYDRGGKRVQTVLADFKGQNQATITLSTKSLQVGVRYRMSVSIEYYHATHDKRWFPFELK
ncbi:MAG: sulfatase-like hydrolase/transferase [Proteobacteria bacterium]|nr:sulfatase-like hydrolase/transferase [Pseudomonadota bacterium]